VLPLIVVAASDDSRQGAPPRNRSLRDQLVEELRHRYDRDFEVMGSDITGLLQEMSISTRPVAAVIAGSDQEAGARAAVQLLAQVRATSANTRRILLVQRGAWRTHQVRDAMVLGHVDGYLFVPWAQREQWLYQPMTEYLAGWERSRPAARTAFTVIGRQHDQRSHALRDIFARVEELGIGRLRSRRLHR
jgi:thioredoxin reductase (NADPH)